MGWEFILDDSTTGGILFLTVHICFVMTMSVQCESVFYSSLKKADYFNRVVVQVNGSQDDLIEAVFQLDDTVFSLDRLQ